MGGSPPLLIQFFNPSLSIIVINSDLLVVLVVVSVVYFYLSFIFFGSEFVFVLGVSTILLIDFFSFLGGGVGVVAWFWAHFGVVRVSGCFGIGL